MPKPNYQIEWDKSGEHLYETGVDRGVLYPMDDNGNYTNGAAWNGLSSVTESPSGAEPTAIWADNRKYLNMYSAEEYGSTIEAYTYPDEFKECDGSKEIAPGVYAGQQARKTFGFSYRTLIGNDIQENNHGYKIHLVYGCKASPSERNYSTTNDSPEAQTMSWEISTTPINVTGIGQTSQLTIDSTKTTAEKLTAIEEILYGKAASGQTAAVQARLPLPDEVISLMS